MDGLAVRTKKNGAFGFPTIARRKEYADYAILDETLGFDFEITYRCHKWISGTKGGERLSALCRTWPILPCPQLDCLTEFGLRAGPASLLSLSPEPGGWVLAWGPGRIEETRYEDMRGPNAMFRFDSGPSGDAISRWIGSGATHHNALAPGDLELEIPVLASALGVRLVRV